MTMFIIIMLHDDDNDDVNATYFAITLSYLEINLTAFQINIRKIKYICFIPPTH